MTQPTVSDYTPVQQAACSSILIDLIHILGDFIDNMALVGGWVPALLIPDATEKYVGTMDIDLALDAKNISQDAYATIHKLLTINDYRQNDKANAQFKYFKDIMVEGQNYTVEVDLLTGEYLGETGRNRRHESIQDTKALKARGTDLVFGRTKMIKVTGTLPRGGGKNTVTCKIAGVVPFIVMKGIVLKRRKKEKDAYDLEYVLRNYPDSIDAIARLIEPDINNAVVREALLNIKEAFETLDHYGPTAIVNFLEIDDEEERVIIKQRAYQTIKRLLDKGLLV